MVDFNKLREKAKSRTLEVDFSRIMEANFEPGCHEVIYGDPNVELIPTTPTLYEAWIGLNDRFIFKPDSLSSMGLEAFTNKWWDIQKGPVTLKAVGFGLPNQWSPLVSGKRVELLTKRYIDPQLWEEFTIILQNGKKHMGGKKPYSFGLLFHRRAETGKVPKGGGCLLSLVLTWWDGWNLTISSRASEITSRLLGDIYFMRSLVDSINPFLKIPVDPTTVRINWFINLANQSAHMIPVFMLVTKTPEFTKMFFSTPPSNPWQEVIKGHFFKHFIHPELITWSQRKKWSEQFFQMSGLNPEDLVKWENNKGGKLVEDL